MNFRKLTASNIMLFAAKHYDNPSCLGQAEFLDDMKRFKYVKRLFRKYSATGELRTRLIINHIIVLTNVFGVDAATTMLFFKVEKEYWPLLKTFLIFLSFMPNTDMIEIDVHKELLQELNRI
jgi:hypothetical protein|tara:strand:+ start:127 stop:492 length:366 start_codon:yes stop_codon:yes gene_type:complete